MPLTVVRGGYSAESSIGRAGPPLSTAPRRAPSTPKIRTCTRGRSGMRRDTREGRQRVRRIHPGMIAGRRSRGSIETCEDFRNATAVEYLALRRFFHRPPALVRRDDDDYRSGAAWSHFGKMVQKKIRDMTQNFSPGVAPRQSFGSGERRFRTGSRLRSEHLSEPDRTARRPDLARRGADARRRFAGQEDRTSPRSGTSN